MIWRCSIICITFVAFLFGWVVLVFSIFCIPYFAVGWLSDSRSLHCEDFREASGPRVVNCVVMAFALSILVAYIYL